MSRAAAARYLPGRGENPETQLVRSGAPEAKKESVFYGVRGSIASKANEKGNKKDEIAAEEKAIL